MVSIYDADLTDIKQEKKVFCNYLSVNSSLIVKKINGSLKRLIPLFDYDTVENTNATLFKVLNDKTIIVNNSFNGNMLFTSENTGNNHEYNVQFNITQYTDILLVLLYDKYGTVLTNEIIEVYTSTDDMEYTLDSTLITDTNGQTIYTITDEEITSIKFKAGDEEYVIET